MLLIYDVFPGVARSLATTSSGTPFFLESDHKLSISLLNTKHLDDLPPRIMRFRLRLAKYDFMAQHIPGKLQMRSRELTPKSTRRRRQKPTSSMSQSPRYLQCLVYGQAQVNNMVCAKVREYCQSLWPSRTSSSPSGKYVTHSLYVTTLCME